MKLTSKFEFISQYFELPLLGNNAEWLTNKWVYLITAIVGSVTGMRALEYTFTGWSLAEASSVVLIYGLIFVISAWAGCTTVGFVKIPVLRFAVLRSVFQLVALSLIFLSCAVLGAIALLLIIVIIVGVVLGGPRRRGSSMSADSGSDDTIYDGNGNIHYKASQDGDRVITTGGDTMHRMPDGTYRSLNND